MAFCSFSSKLVLDNYTVIDNTFLNEFLPGATGDAVKVYLYGLTLCANTSSTDNNMETICKVLSLSQADVEKAFSYWQEMGLVQVVSANPYEVRYLPVRAHSGSVKIRNKDKYADFNKMVEEAICDRMVTPIEFNEYYSLMEVYHFEPEALIMIIRYCVKNKSTSVGYPYILAVARDFAHQGLKTYETVEAKFIEQDKSSAEIKQILSALGIKREADIDERNMYLKWKNSLGFTHGAIIEVAKSLKKHGGFNRLDETLTKYYEQKLFSIEEISNYSSRKELLFEIAKSVTKNLGLYFGDLENVVNVYISDWIQKGYEKETLEFISNYAFKQNLRTLDGMNTIVQKFFKLGLVSMEAIDEYIAEILANDEQIREVLDTLGLLRSVSSFDRDLYRTWTNDWGFEQDAILLVAKSSKGTANPIAYMNKILSGLHTANKHQTNEVKAQLETNQTPKSQKSIRNNVDRREYSSEEFAAVFDSLDDVEI
ncbi:MAG: DnaD domain protein [Clostridia bacterium]|nr:DnaD domain protein [Clostridia bacterium]